jgi:hypothetical protein
MIILKNLPLPHRYRRSGGGSGSAAMDISDVKLVRSNHLQIFSQVSFVIEKIIVISFYILIFKYILY